MGMKIRQLLFVFFLLVLFSFSSLFVSAQERQKTPAATLTPDVFQAPKRFDRVDRNKNKILDDLEEQISDRPESDRFDVIVLLNEQLDLLPALKGRNGDFQESFTYPSINGFATNLTKGQIIAFGKDLDVKQIEFDAPFYPHLDTSQQWFGTAKARGDFGVDGNADGSPSYSSGDIVIGILDSGIDPGHVDLDAGKIIAWRDFTPNNGQTPYDEGGACSGHGTHVASIAAGEGQANANFKGVAPGAALIGLKVLRIQGSNCVGQTSWVNAAIQWLIDNKATFGIEVGNMSLGIAGCSDGGDSTSTLVNNAVGAGIVMTVSAGNEGPGTCTIGSPAAAENAITVGAMSDVAPMSISANFSCGPVPYRGFSQACFSSRGPTADNRTKPDVSSPGVFINAASQGTASSYKELSGTSMSSPFTAGVAALILDAHPAHTPAQVKSEIESTAIDWGVASKDIDYGSGRLQGYEAVKQAAGFSGTNVSTPSYTHLSGFVPSGGFDEQTIEVTDASFPLAATMIITSGSGTNPDLDLEIRNAAGSALFSCSGGPFSTSPCPCTTDSDGICKSRTTRRQETVGFQPSSTGTYKLRVVSFSGSGDYFLDVSFGQPAVAISLTTDGDTPFGVVSLGATVDTTPSGTNDVQTVQVTTGPANLSVKSTNFSDGANTWTLGTANSADQVLWEFSKDASTWNTFSTADTLFSLDTNVAQSDSRDLYLRLTMPTETSFNNQHSSTVTIVATAP